MAFSHSGVAESGHSIPPAAARQGMGQSQVARWRNLRSRSRRPPGRGSPKTHQPPSTQRSYLRFHISFRSARISC